MSINAPFYFFYTNLGIRIVHFQHKFVVGHNNILELVVAGAVEEEEVVVGVVQVPLELQDNNCSRFLGNHYYIDTCVIHTLRTYCMVLDILPL